MITPEFAMQFASAWAAAWNEHNLDKVLSHYSDDFSIVTPMALRLMPETQGTVTGKENVRAYWTIGLEHIANLHFEVLDVLIGIDSLTIYYLNTATGRKSAENLFFDAQMKVTRAIVMYS